MIASMPPLTSVFPPLPPAFHGRQGELSTLTEAIRAAHPTRIALIGAGGSGKSTLACALGHHLESEFPGGIHWFRIGAWDPSTLLGMLSLRFGVRQSQGKRALRQRLAALGKALVVLDNHENDRALAELLDTLRAAPVTWIVTARRCLVAGMSLFPVAPPLVVSGENPFPAVASLTRLLRWNPVALEIADAAVRRGEAREEELGAYLLRRGVNRVRVIAHEDDLPEVALVVEWSWARLSPAARRMMAVLAHMGGDHMDAHSLARLSRAGKASDEALADLSARRLVQEPLPGRFALHATVRHAALRRTQFPPRRLFEHYVSLLEMHPERLEPEQTHLFAAMDFAHDTGDLGAAIRVRELVSKLGI
jgi:hypothetical protein